MYGWLSVIVCVCVTSQEQVGQHSALMVKGMLGLLNTCPQEVAHLRKEMLIAARHILATDLRKCEYPHDCIDGVLSMSLVWFVASPTMHCSLFS